ncbi:MAG: hypothetical protein AAGI25_15570 [Bacteroidota bacterium]
MGTDVGNAVASTSGRMGQGVLGDAASRGFIIEVGELSSEGTIYDREHLEFLRNEYNREVLGRGVLTSEELIARIHQAQKDFDDFTGLSTIVTLPGGGMVMKGGLKLAARALQIRRVARGGKSVLNAVNTGQRTGSAAYKSLNVNDAQHFFSNIVDNHASQATKFGLKGGDGVIRLVSNRRLFKRKVRNF